MSDGDAGGRDGGDAGDDMFLPRSLYAPQDDPREDVREIVNSVLSDKFMAFLSILLIPIILLPFFFNFSAQALDFFDICDATVVILFVVEYLAKLYLAKSRWEYFKSPWHLLDLVIVVFSFLQYLPLLGLNIRGSPALLLRLLRLPRALAVTGRVTGSRIRGGTTVATEQAQEPDTVIQTYDSSGVHTGLDWNQVSAHLSTKQEEWIDIEEISEEGIRTLSRMLRIPERHFKTSLLDEIFPHIDYVQQSSFIFLKSSEIEYPERADTYMRISQAGLVVICSGPKIITLSPHRMDLFPRITGSMPDPLGKSSFVTAALYEILSMTLKSYKSIFSEIELEVVRIGNTPRAKLPKDFLNRMYQLKKEVARLVSNLVHFKNLLNILISKNVPIEGFDQDAKEAFNVLLDETVFQNEIADDLTSNIGSLIDLYINQTSFDTNRILKILAVITGVSVIPAAVGGILGMNLLDTPYQAYLWEVVLITLMSMAFATYTFFKLGWLKT